MQLNAGRTDGLWIRMPLQICGHFGGDELSTRTVEAVCDFVGKCDLVAESAERAHSDDSVSGDRYSSFNILARHLAVQLLAIKVRGTNVFKRTLGSC